MAVKVKKVAKRTRSGGPVRPSYIPTDAFGIELAGGVPPKVHRLTYPAPYQITNVIVYNDGPSSVKLTNANWSKPLILDNGDIVQVTVESELSVAPNGSAYSTVWVQYKSSTIKG